MPDPEALRAEIRSGALHGAALRALIEAVPYRDRDAFTDELLGMAPPPPDVALPPGGVPYLPCGVAEILALTREAPLGPGDQLVDLGAGLGRVVLLAHLLSGARARGVEIQAPLVRAARARAADLALDVEFAHGDAAEAALDGSVFFLYAPFNGATLARVLSRLEEVARRRRIVVAAVDLALPGQPWLLPRATSSLALTLYDSGR
jgi:SAM-dependent methyltransferase